MPSKKYRYVDHLDEDKPIPGKRFYHVSFISPEGVANTTLRLLKVRNFFATYEEAQESLDMYDDKDKDGNPITYPTYIGEVGKWCPWDSAEGADVKTTEEEMNNLAAAYKKNQAQAKKVEAERKADLITDSVKSNMSRKEKQLRRMRARLAKQKVYEIEAKKQQKDYDEKLAEIELKKKGGDDKVLEEKEAKFKDIEQLAKEEAQRLKEVDNKITKKEEKVKDVKTQLAKIEELYKKIKVNTNKE